MKIYYLLFIYNIYTTYSICDERRRERDPGDDERKNTKIQFFGVIIIIIECLGFVKKHLKKIHFLVVSRYLIRKKTNLEHFYHEKCSKTFCKKTKPKHSIIHILAYYYGLFLLLPGSY
jgi:hypothetical protein